MPWLALDYTERSLKVEYIRVLLYTFFMSIFSLQEKLASGYGIRGIPTLILIDGDSGELITGRGRDWVQNNDTKGENFPWRE